MKKCRVIAEIGGTHLGSLDRAKELARLARISGVKYLKSQKRNPIESVPEELQNAPHPNPQFSYGETYLEHRQNLELPIEDHDALLRYCEDELDIYYSLSVWDMTSAQEVIDMNPAFIKVGSPSNQHWDMLKLIFDEYEGTGEEDIHISLGMVTWQERTQIVQFAADQGVDPQRLVWYHCTSEYPCPFDRLYLREVQAIREVIDPRSSVGFSNHGFGIAADVAAYTLGATWVERHFIDDRTIRHTDAAPSLEPAGIQKLCRDLNAVHKALQAKEQMSEDELAQRKKLKGM